MRRVSPMQRDKLAHDGEVHGAGVDVTQRRVGRVRVRRRSRRVRRCRYPRQQRRPGRGAPFAKTDLALWQRMLDVNLTGVFLCTQAVLARMLERGSGRIVNVASTAGQVGYAYVAAYCAAKHGVIGLTRSLALEVATTRRHRQRRVPRLHRDGTAARNRSNRSSQQTSRSEDEARDALLRSESATSLRHARAKSPIPCCGCARPARDAITGQAISISGGEVM